VRLRIVLAAAAVAMGTLVPGVARADARADLEKAHNAYAARRYDDAEARLRALLASGELKDPDTIADARMYLGATLLAEKKDEDAARTFELLLTDKPEYQPDPLRVSLEAQDAFTDAKTRMHDRLAAMQAERVRQAQAAQAKLEEEKQRQARRLVMLEDLASTETVIERHSRWFALVPFGAGQFQNGQTAEGWLFLLGEGLLAGGSVVASGFSVYYATQAGQQYNDQNFGASNGYTRAARLAAYTGDVLAGALVLAGVGGIIHAQATFVPETVEKRKRAIPQLSLTPMIGPGGLGLGGTF
jgi:transcription elongation GreA/GreB family factor